MVIFASFRAWLASNLSRETGIRIAFEKGNKRFTALDALEESLCFGWIDGVMKSIDEATYRKYFSPRRDAAKWSDKNKALYADLARRGLMTAAGIAAYKPSPALTVADHPKALRLCESKPPSRQKQFAGFYCDAKTDETRAKRKGKIAQALRDGYEGMSKILLGVPCFTGIWYTGAMHIHLLGPSGSGTSTLGKAFIKWAESYEDGGLDMRSRKSETEWIDQATCKVLRIEREIPINEEIALVTKRLTGGNQ